MNLSDLKMDVIYTLCDKADIQGISTSRQPIVIVALLARVMNHLPMLKELPNTAGSYDTSVLHRHFSADALEECDDIIKDELVELFIRFTPNTFYRTPPLYRFLDSNAIELYIHKTDLTEAHDE